MAKRTFIHEIESKYDLESELEVIRTQSDKVLRDKATKIASDPKYDGYQRGLASMVYMFFW